MAGKSSDFETETVKEHNAYRARHGCPPLKWSAALQKVAQGWANTIAKKDRMEHMKNNDYGENIYYKWSSNPNYTVTAKEAVDSWYSEIKFHNFKKNTSTPKTGHFTQVIWKSTTEVGMAQARSSTNKTYIVAEYNPPGNYENEYIDNIPTAKSR